MPFDLTPGFMQSGSSGPSKMGTGNDYGRSQLMASSRFQRGAGASKPMMARRPPQKQMPSGMQMPQQSMMQRQPGSQGGQAPPASGPMTGSGSMGAWSPQVKQSYDQGQAQGQDMSWMQQPGAISQQYMTGGQGGVNTAPSPMGMSRFGGLGGGISSLASMFGGGGGRFSGTYGGAGLNGTGGIGQVRQPMYGQGNDYGLGGGNMGGNGLWGNYNKLQGLGPADGSQPMGQLYY